MVSDSPKVNKPLPWSRGGLSCVTVSSDPPVGVLFTKKCLMPGLLARCSSSVKVISTNDEPDNSVTSTETTVGAVESR